MPRRAEVRHDAWTPSNLSLLDTVIVLPGDVEIPLNNRVAMKSLLTTLLTGLALLGCMAACEEASAQVTFTASSVSQNLAASATFSLLAGNQLQVTLTNTYLGNTVDQSHVLTGIFFSGATALTPVSANAGPNAVEWSGTSTITLESSAALGQQWAYASGSGAPNNAQSGIVSSGYWSAVGHGNFSSNGAMLDGSAYGLLSEGYAGSDLDGLSTRDFIQPGMVFVLSGFTGSLSGISDVSFQYGTTFGTEPNLTASLTATPEPKGVWIPAACLLVLVWATGLGRRIFPPRVQR